MFVIRRFFTVALLAALPLSSCLALTRTELLPPEAGTFLRISNTTNFVARLKSAPIGKLWADQQVQDFLGHPDPALLLELLYEPDTEAEADIIRQQIKMLGGEVILGYDFKTEREYTIAAITEADFKRTLELDQHSFKISNEPYEVMKSTFQETEITQYIKHPGSPHESTSWLAFHNGTMLIGGSKEWVERSLVRIKKDPIAEPEGLPRFTLNLPLAKFIRTFLLKELKQDAAKQELGFEPETMLEALGLMGLERGTITVELQPSQMTIDTMLHASDLDKGFFSILDVQPSEMPSVAYMPENISSFEVGRFNLLRFWKEIPNVLATAMPAVKPQFDMMLAMIQQQTGINFEQDLLTHLDTRYFSYAETTDTEQTSLIAVELKDPIAFKQGLEAALAAPMLQPQVSAALNIESFLDHTLYSLKNPEPNAPTETFAVVGNHVVYGDGNAVRQAIRSKEKPDGRTLFERNALIQGLRKQIPDTAFSYSAIDWKKSMKAVMGELLKPEYTGWIQNEWATSGAPVPPPDFSKIPPIDHIASFFNTSFQFVERVPQGLHNRVILNY